MNAIKWLTIQGVADWLGVTDQTIKNWIDGDVFPAYQVNPRGRVLIREQGVAGAIERGMILPKQWFL